MPRRKSVEPSDSVEPDIDVAEEGEEKIEEAEEEDEEPVPAKASGTGWGVLSRDGKFIRAYSLEDHGEGAEGLAGQFAAKIGGSVQAS